MKKIIKILLSITIGLIYSQNIDTLLFGRSVINDKAILVPDYEIESSEFVIEYLDKRKFFFTDLQLTYLEDDEIKINFSPSLDLKNFKFKINLEYSFDRDSTNNYNYVDLLSFFESIQYFRYNLLDNKINLFLGEIEDFSLGHGYLVNKYNNSYSYPIKRNIGLSLNLNNRNKSFEYGFFVSNLRDFAENSGIVANKISLLYSDGFPLKFGFGHVMDLNQFSKYKDLDLDFSRKINAFQFDFTFPIFGNQFERLYFIGEIAAIDLPEKRYYMRVDDSQFTNDKKSRNGIWGIAFPGIIYKNQKLMFKFSLNYNSAIFSPHYFNSTYDFENVRFRIYNISKNEVLYTDEAQLLENYSNSDSTLFIPKDMYGMINQSENTYPTYGFS